MKSAVSALSNLSDVEVDRVVKIAGTQYDRRRVVTEKMLKQARKYLKKGKDYDYISRKLHLDARTIRYHLDDEYRAQRKKNARTAGSKVCPLTYEESVSRLVERASYKKSLVASGKLAIQ